MEQLRRCYLKPCLPLQSDPVWVQALFMSNLLVLGTLRRSRSWWLLEFLSPHHLVGDLACPQMLCLETKVDEWKIVFPPLLFSLSLPLSTFKIFFFTFYFTPCLLSSFFPFLFLESMHFNLDLALVRNRLQFIGTRTGVLKRLGHSNLPDCQEGDEPPAQCDSVFMNA